MVKKNIYTTSISITLKDVMMNVAGLGWCTHLTANPEIIGDDELVNDISDYVANIEFVPFQNSTEYEPLRALVIKHQTELVNEVKKIITEGLAQTDWETEDANSFTANASMGEYVTISITCQKAGDMTYDEETSES